MCGFIKNSSPGLLKPQISLETISCLTACHKPQLHLNLHIPKENRFYFRKGTALGELGTDGVDDISRPFHLDGHEVPNVYDQVMSQVSLSRCAFDSQTVTL